MTTDMDDLKDRVRESVREYHREGYMDEYPEDSLHEIADSHTPVYNSDLLELPQTGGYMYLATEQPEHASNLGEEGSAINAIAANVYNELLQVAHEEYDKIKNQKGGDKDMGHLGNYIVQPAKKASKRKSKASDCRHRAWEVKRENAEQASRVFDSSKGGNREDAIKKGKELAKKHGCAVKFRNSRNGQFREVRDYN